MKQHKLKRKSTKGFSLLEIMVVIAIIGILSAISIKSFRGVQSGSKNTIATNLLESLNSAVKEFSHAQYQIVSSGENGDALDEMHILQTLQWIDPAVEFGIAGPFMRTNWIPSESSDTEDHRLVWTGVLFKLAGPGEVGSGIKIDFGANDVGAEFQHGAGWNPISFDSSNLGNPSQAMLKPQTLPSVEFASSQDAAAEVAKLNSKLSSFSLGQDGHVNT